MVRNQKLHKRALEKHGFEHQRGIWVEELSELIHALMKLTRPGTPEKLLQRLQNVQVEIADVILVTEQMQVYFDDFVIQDKYDAVEKRYRDIIDNGIDSRDGTDYVFDNIRKVRMLKKLINQEYSLIDREVVFHG